MGADPATSWEYRLQLRQHGIVKLEQTFLTKDGRDIPVEITANPVEFESRQIQEVLHEVEHVAGTDATI